MITDLAVLGCILALAWAAPSLGTRMLHGNQGRITMAGLPAVLAVGLALVFSLLCVAGYLLSALTLLASPLAWALVVGLVVGLARPWSAPRPVGPGWRRLGRLLLGRPLLLAAFVTLALIALNNVLLLALSAPTSWDSLLYHLPRVAFYLQQGHCGHYDANYFSQDELGKNSALVITALSALGARTDFVTGIPQFAAWLAGGASMAAITLGLGARLWAGLFGGAAWMLLSIAWLQATTAQNDLQVAAWCQTSLLCLLQRGQRSRPPWPVVCAGLFLGLAIGTKASALLVVPVVLFVGLLHNGEHLCARGGRAPRLALFLLSALLLSLPAAYLENWQTYGHPLGARIRTETFHKELSRPEHLRSILRNAVRYGLDACTLDEEPLFKRVAGLLAERKQQLCGWLARGGLNLEEKQDMRIWMPFWPHRLHRADENASYLGPYSLLIAFGLLRALRMRGLRLWPWLFAALFVVHCAVGPYDFIRGRQFLALALLGLVPAALWLGRGRRSSQRLWAVLALLAGVHLVSAALVRNNQPLIGWNGRSSVLSQDRLTQMLSQRPERLAALRLYEAEVPRQARVAVSTDGDEYLFAGYRLRRQLVLVPRPSKESPAPEPPADVDYFVFQGEALRRPTDLSLGAGLYLRRISSQETRDRVR